MAEMEEGIWPKNLFSERSSVVSWVSWETRGESWPEYSAASRVIVVTLVASGEQLMPQMKWVRRGRAQGSEEKSQEARHDHERMELGLTAALKALRAEMSWGEVRDWDFVKSWRNKKKKNKGRKKEEKDDFCIFAGFYFL